MKPTFREFVACKLSALLLEMTLWWFIAQENYRLFLAHSCWKRHLNVIAFREHLCRKWHIRREQKLRLIFSSAFLLEMTSIFIWRAQTVDNLANSPVGNDTYTAGANCHLFREQPCRKWHLYREQKFSLISRTVMSKMTRILRTKTVTDIANALYILLRP